ncbi:hypothetical protein V8C42DRAFT_326310 [Trichoderma barbatum]
MATTTEQLVDADQEEIVEPKISYTWTYWHARFTELNEYEHLPCPVETQGAHLISAPPSPKAVESRHDPSSFYDDLFERLRGLALRQSIREHIYGEEFANEWAISRTPRALANEIKAARQKALEAELHLDSPSTSESELQPGWWRRVIRESREKREAKKQAKALAQAQALAQAHAQGESKAHIQAQDPDSVQVQTEAHVELQAQAQTPLECGAAHKTEQPAIHIVNQTSKKRKAPPTPVTPSPKRARVM